MRSFSAFWVVVRIMVVVAMTVVRGETTFSVGLVDGSMPSGGGGEWQRFLLPRLVCNPLAHPSWARMRASFGPFLSAESWLVCSAARF